MEFRNVLVYADGRPECERAVAVGAESVRKNGGRLRLVHVVEPPASVPGLDADVGRAIEAAQAEELERLSGLARKLGVEADCEARVGSPFVELIRSALRAGCDLVVKSATGRPRLGWPLLGSTALHLVRKCPVPVWLVGDHPDPLPRRIIALLGSDGSSEARQILDRRVLSVACSIAETIGAEIRVGAAWDAPGASLLERRMPGEALRAYVEGARREAEEGLGRALATFTRRINPARVHLVRGVPHLELAELASREADLAVIGTTPPSAGSAFLIREEAEDLINRLETSIVAVKAADFVSPVQ